MPQIIHLCSDPVSRPDREPVRKLRSLGAAMEDLICRNTSRMFKSRILPVYWTGLLEKT
jgi:hypothetical protein